MAKKKPRHAPTSRESAPTPAPDAAPIVVAETSMPAADAPSPLLDEMASPAAGSVVDVVFDHLTDLATKGLAVAKRGLEATARFLDAQAKRAGDLAEKMRAKSDEPSPAAE